jgi:dsRNA-specific ribonuclease
MTVLCDPESMKIYDQVFTHDSFDAVNNYQIYETLGDASFKHFIIWYMHERFPDADPSTLSRLWILWGSKDMMYQIAERLGFWPYISTGLEPDKNKDMKNVRQSKRKGLLEDVFEAFIGATEYILDKRFRKGVGNAIVNNILTYFYNLEDIRIDREVLYDPKTRLKEFFDKHSRRLGTLEYVYRQDKMSMIHFIKVVRMEDKIFYRYDRPMSVFDIHTTVRNIVCNDMEISRNPQDDQIAMMKKQMGLYSLSINPNGFILYKKMPVVLSREFSGAKKNDVEKMAAENAIQTLKNQGYTL